MTKKKQSSIIVALVVIAIVSTTTMAFAFWYSGYNGDVKTEAGVVEIGEGKVVDTTLTLVDMGLTPGKSLIPKNITPTGDDVNEITFAVKVKWKSDVGGGLTGVTAPLAIRVTDIKDGLDSLSSVDQGLFAISYGTPQVVGDSDEGIDVSIVVTMAEPVDEDQYARVAGKNLDFTFEFSVADQA